MVSLMLIVVGFLAVTGAVMALARASTARWERDKRAPVAVRTPDVADRRTSSVGAALRLPAAVTRRAAALRRQVYRLAPVKAVAQWLSAATTQGSSRVPAVRGLRRGLRSALSAARIRVARWAPGRSAAAPLDGEEADPAAAPTPARAVTGNRSDDSSRAAGRKVPRRRPRAPRRALAFLHRHEDPHEARIPRADSDESPTAPR
jgi:hypothetical protein